MEEVGAVACGLELGGAVPGGQDRSAVEGGVLEVCGGEPGGLQFGDGPATLASKRRSQNLDIAVVSAPQLGVGVPGIPEGGGTEPDRAQAGGADLADAQESGEVGVGGPGDQRLSETDGGAVSAGGGRDRDLRDTRGHQFVGAEPGTGQRQQREPGPRKLGGTEPRTLKVRSRGTGGLELIGVRSADDDRHRPGGGVDSVGNGDRERIRGVCGRGPALTQGRGVGVGPGGGVDGDRGSACGGGRGAVGQGPPGRVGERHRPVQHPRSPIRTLQRSTAIRRRPRQPGPRNRHRLAGTVDPIGHRHRERIRTRAGCRLTLNLRRGVGVATVGQDTDRGPTHTGDWSAIGQSPPRRIGERHRPIQHPGGTIRATHRDTAIGGRPRQPGARNRHRLTGTVDPVGHRHRERIRT